MWKCMCKRVTHFYNSDKKKSVIWFLSRKNVLLFPISPFSYLSIFLSLNMKDVTLKVSGVRIRNYTPNHYELHWYEGKLCLWEHMKLQFFKERDDPSSEQRRGKSYNKGWFWEILLNLCGKLLMTSNIFTRIT